MTKKFRIWDHQLKLFWIGSIREIFGHLPTDISDNQIQQWTGLTDSQGVEIYEGDIITFRPKSNKPPFWEVIFDHGLAMYCLFNRKKEAFFEYEDMVANICGPDTRIIGNIFQTPELLEKC